MRIFSFCNYFSKIFFINFLRSLLKDFSNILAELSQKSFPFLELEKGAFFRYKFFTPPCSLVSRNRNIVLKNVLRSQLPAISICLALFADCVEKNSKIIDPRQFVFKCTILKKIHQKLPFRFLPIDLRKL